MDFHLTPLEAEETDQYIMHRLKVAGGRSNIFHPVARRFIHYQCNGVPRLINSMCDTSLVYGFAEGADIIYAELVYGMALERVDAGLFGAGLTADTVVDGDSDRNREMLEENLRRARAEVADD